MADRSLIRFVLNEYVEPLLLLPLSPILGGVTSLLMRAQGMSIRGAIRFGYLVGIGSALTFLVGAALLTLSVWAMPALISILGLGLGAYLLIVAVVYTAVARKIVRRHRLLEKPSLRDTRYGIQRGAAGNNGIRGLNSQNRPADQNEI
jgi:hypothetical protein